MLRSSVAATNLSTVPFDDRVDVWRRLCSESLIGDVAWPTRTNPDQFDGYISRRWIEDLLFVEYASSGFGARYRPDSPANDYIGFGVSPASYGERLTMRDSSVVNLWGTAYMWANSSVREYEQIGSGHSLILYVPREALRAVGVRSVGNIDMMAELDTPTTRMLSVMLAALRDETEIVNPAEAIALRNSLLELTSRVAAERDLSTSTAAVSAAMKQSIMAWIDRRLQFGPVSPAEAAAEHGISVRSVHRLFEDGNGSFSATVRAARLAHARRDVVDSADSFQVIAMRWGFSDASHFSREFRKTYGVAPRDLRTGPVATGDRPRR